MQGNLPVLQALRNPALRDRHWTKLAGIMATPLVTDPPLTLAQLLDLKVGCNLSVCHYPTNLDLYIHNMMQVMFGVELLFT